MSQKKSNIKTKAKHVGGRPGEMNLQPRETGKVWLLGETLPQAKGKATSPFNPGRGSKGR